MSCAKRVVLDVNLKVKYYTFIVIWATVAGILTFDGPFRDTGNGYFATWAGFIVVIFFANHQFSREDEIV